MDVPRIMQRAFPGNRVKSAGGGTTEILDLAGQGRNCLVCLHADDPCRGSPGGPAGGAALHLNPDNPVAGQLHGVFWQAELATIFACQLQAPEAASGKRGNRPFVFFPRGNDRDMLPATNNGEVLGEILMIEEIQNQVRIEVVRNKLFRFIDQDRQAHFDIDPANDCQVTAMPENPGDFPGAGLIFLENNQPVWFCLLRHPVPLFMFRLPVPANLRFGETDPRSAWQVKD